MSKLLKYSLLQLVFLASLNCQAQFSKFLKKTDSTLKVREKEDSAKLSRGVNQQTGISSNSTNAGNKQQNVGTGNDNHAAQSNSSIRSSSGGQSTSNAQAHTGPAPTEHEMQGGIKQALQQALESGIAKVSATDGFFKDASIKLLFPPEARKAEKTLRNLGLGSVCDRVILQMNRAAEDASKKAAPVFLSALKQMSVKDGASILAGAPNAATTYFQSHTTAELSKTFKPVIDQSLNKLKVKALYSQVVSKYNSSPLAESKVDTDLSDYATNQAIQGLFTSFALEETKLRAKSGLNASPLVRKVFGYFSK